MKTANFKLESRTPMLMNKFSFGKKSDQISVSDTDALSDAVRTKKIAEEAAYRNEKGQLIIPADNLYRALITAGKKVQKGKSNFSTVVAGSVQIAGDLLLTDEKGKALTDFETDIKRGKNPSTKGSVPIIRARVDRWQAVLSLRYDDQSIKETDLLKIVEALGNVVGFLDFRPEKLGSYGQFIVKSAAKSATA
jgi:hypothetical protein